LYFQFGTGSLIGQELDKSTRWAGQGGSGIRRNRHRGSLNLSVFATLKQGVLYIKKPNITSLVSACHHRILTHLASRTLIPGTPPLPDWGGPWHTMSTSAYFWSNSSGLLWNLPLYQSCSTL
jgi:hypothetical protein